MTLPMLDDDRPVLDYRTPEGPVPRVTRPTSIVCTFLGFLCWFPTVLLILCGVERVLYGPSWGDGIAFFLLIVPSAILLLIGGIMHLCINPDDPPVGAGFMNVSMASLGFTVILRVFQLISR